MLAKRIVAALDIKDGRVVKGVKFVDLKDAGDPVQLAKRYEEEGVDEIVFLDISASNEKRGILEGLVKDIAREVNIPFTVGGGLKDVDGIRDIVKHGADKVFINTAAVENPVLIKDASQALGSSNLVIAVDAKWDGDRWEVYTHGGRKARGLDLIEWSKKIEDLGAGEILLTSMDADGTKDGYDIPMLEAVVKAVNIPVVASGGAGKPEHFKDAFLVDASAALAASVFHYKEIDIGDLKRYLDECGVNVRL